MAYIYDALREDGDSQWRMLTEGTMGRGTLWSLVDDIVRQNDGYVSRR